MKKKLITWFKVFLMVFSQILFLKFVSASTDSSIVIAVEKREHRMLVEWLLYNIRQVPSGKETLVAIEATSHKVTIRHEREAYYSGGLTRAPATMALIDGRGASVVIELNFDAPLSGTHRVYDCNDKPIEFTLEQTLFHELVHARHKMQGTWRYFDSEGQAIEGENIFRQQQAVLMGRATQERCGIEGQLLWEPDSLNIRASRLNHPFRPRSSEVQSRCVH